MTSRTHWQESEFDCKICGSSDTVLDMSSDRVYCQKCEFMDLIEEAKEDQKRA